MGQKEPIFFSGQLEVVVRKKISYSFLLFSGISNECTALLRVLCIGFSIKGIASMNDFARDVVQGGKFLTSQIVALEVHPLSTISLDLTNSGIGF